MYNIIPVHALNDNYIWIIKAHNGSDCICIDPGEADPVKKFLDENNLTLSSILITHHHFDHTAGINDLYKQYSPKIFVPNKSIHAKAYLVSDNDKVTIDKPSLSFQVLSIPGHTLDHVAYVIDKNIFTGDTLFSAGCGKIFEGTYEMMYNSLKIITSFPDEYKIFCGHEYTKNNLEFASKIDVNNSMITSKLKEICAIGENLVTLPSTIGIEKQINPFLRCNNSDIIQNVQNFCHNTLQDPVEVFKNIRKLKDKF